MEPPHYPGKRFAAPASAVLALSLLLSACGGNAPTVRHSPSVTHTVFPAVWPIVTPENPDAANAVLMRALSLVGTPYRYGGNTPESGFDCSGLVGYVFHDVLSRQLPRNSGELARLGEGVGFERMATGDLVVFGDAASVSHVGIYVGEGRFVHAPSTGGTVRLDRLDGPYWRDHFRGARRVLM
ncbi:C40 family peptidase [Cognatilysobacter terrigena]|uniref:C40 family peptidase n=1 Tax=Cognatilysobacter terrigena TaxID=2488749 RepID=UPI001FE561E4|nr:C40 family peptidase [Lysobacter terrigena]